MTRQIRTSLAMIAAAAVTAMVATPAGADSFEGVYVNDHTVESTGGGKVTGVCSAVTTLPSNSINTIRVALKYDVAADSAAWAVGGICEVRDKGGSSTSASYGSVPASGPGMYASGVGEVYIPRQIVNPVTCNIPEAIFIDGTEGNPLNSRKCAPIS